MGFHVSTLHNLPVGNIEYFVHVLDIGGSIQAEWIAENLHTLAKSFGPKAGLVTGTAELTNELYDFLAKHVSDGQVESVLLSVPCLVISEGHLSRTNRPVYILSLPSADDSDALREIISTLLYELALAIDEARLADFASSRGAVQVGLSPVGGGIVVCTVREANKLLELKPNIAGVGINLNAVVEKWLGPESRPV